MPRSLTLLFVLILAHATSAWAQIVPTNRVVELRIRMASGAEVRIVEPDGGLATIAPRDSPPLGLTPVIRDLEKRQVRLTVFDLMPGGKPGKRAIEDVDLSTDAATPTTRTAPRLEVTLLGVREVSKEAAHVR